jgi:hypothetical protein
MATLKNTTVDDTGFITVAKGTTAQRPASPTQGMLRYNTSNNVIETYTSSNAWGGLEPPPTISAFSGTINADTNSTITVTGQNFVSGGTVYITGNAVSNVDRALTTTFVSTTSCTAETAAASVNYVGGAAFNVYVVNPSGNQSNSFTGGTVDRDPTWSTASGSLGNIYDGSRTGASFTVTATDPDGQSITSYAVTSGSLPTNMSLASSTGVISGTTSSVGTDTTFTFSITPTSSNGFVGPARSFSITVRAPIAVSYTSTGSGTFSVPTGVTTLQVLSVAAGGAGGGGTGGAGSGGGGGAGGVVIHTSYPVTPGGSVPYNVGTGGSRYPSLAPGQGDLRGTAGGPTTFGNITSIGGGFGGGGNGWYAGGPGGSGGGGGPANGGSGHAGGPGSQPGSGGTGYGNPGGNGGNTATAGGGGGAGQAGSPAGSGNNYGGAGVLIPLTGAYYGGGGGGGQWTSSPGPGGGPGGNGGGGRGGNSGSQNDAQVGGTNQGGGGGGGSENPVPAGWAAGGGPGYIYIKY